MLLLGVALIIIGLLLALPLVFWIGVVLAILGLIAGVAGYGGHPIGGRRYWY